jgi:hypothetical protein
MILISHSFAADDIVATSLEKALLHAGLAPFSLREFGKMLKHNYAGGSDRTDLDNAWRLAGYRRSTQERSDPGLLLKLIDVLRQVDTLLVLWSGEYTRRYWTRIEWKTAMAMCKRIAVVRLDGTPLDTTIAAAVGRGIVPTIELDAAYRTSDVVNMLLSIHERKTGEVGLKQGEVIDAGTGHSFVLLEHPVLGPLEIAKYPITRQQAAELGAGPFSSSEALPSRDGHPLASITWNEAVDVCRQMSTCSTDYEFRLPSEVEWEFAARAGELTVTGLPLDQADRFALFGQPSSYPVGSKEPNGWGLYDMAGNVKTWTSDAGELTEINGWVQPIPKHDPHEGLDRAHIVRGAWFGQSGIRTLSFPFPQRNEYTQAAVGMRVVRCPQPARGTHEKSRGIQCPEK